jgi:thiol-disulfide isomerase/thioredoxin
MKKKNWLTWSAYGAIALLFMLIGVYAASLKPKPSGAVQALHAQTLPDASGVPQALSQWKGKTLVLNFWAPWCAPCVEEMPELSQLQQEHAGKNLQVIGIGIDSPSNIAEFAKKFDIAYPVYVAGVQGTELSRQFGNKAGGLPYTVLIGADGQIKKTYLGRLKFEQLRADLAAL